MKSLVDYIKAVNESKSGKELRFTFGDLANADETISSIESAANKAGIYSEKIDGGIKFKCADDKKDSYETIQDILQQYVDGLTNDEKADQGKVEALANQLNKLNNWLDEEPEESDEKKDCEGKDCDKNDEE